MVWTVFRGGGGVGDNPRALELTPQRACSEALSLQRIMTGSQWHPETARGKGKPRGRNRNPEEAPDMRATNFSPHRKEQWLAVNCVRLDLSAGDSMGHLYWHALSPAGDC